MHRTRAACVMDFLMRASSAATKWVGWLLHAQDRGRFEAAWTACSSNHSPYLCMAQALHGAAPYLSADDVARHESALSECLSTVRVAARWRDLIVIMLWACAPVALGMLGLAFCPQLRRLPDRQDVLVSADAAPPLGSRALVAPARYSCCRNCDGDEPIDLEPLRSYPLMSLRLLPSGQCISARNAAALPSARDPTTNLELFPLVCAH